MIDAATERQINHSCETRLAETTNDRHSAFRLRYEVYIAEQGKPYPEADHEERLLSDDLDRDADVIVVLEADRSSNVRANWFDCALTRARYGYVFELNRFSDIEPGEIAVFPVSPLPQNTDISGLANYYLRHLRAWARAKHSTVFRNLRANSRPHVPPLWFPRIRRANS